MEFSVIEQPRPRRRQRRPKLTNKMVSELKRRAKRYAVPDPEQSGHYVRVMTCCPSRRRETKRAR
jgi:hypothetical protein